MSTTVAAPLNADQKAELREMLDEFCRSPIGSVRLRKFNFKWARNSEGARIAEEDIGGRAAISLSFEDERGWHEFVFAPGDGGGAYSAQLIDLPRATAQIALLKPLGDAAFQALSRKGKANTSQMEQALGGFDFGLERLVEMLAAVPSNGNAWQMPAYSSDDYAVYSFIPAPINSMQNPSSKDSSNDQGNTRA